MSKLELAESNETFSFKTTPVSKVILLSFLTCGFYDLILIFNYWKTIKDNMGLQVSPFWRCIFAVFTNYRLFSILKEYSSKFNINISNASLLATLYLLCTWIDNKLTLQSLALDKTNYTLEIIILILDLATASLLGFVQSKINKVNEQNFPEAEKNPWKVSNIIWVIICGFFICVSFLPG